jgi:hypothetical protein
MRSVQRPAALSLIYDTGLNADRELSSTMFAEQSGRHSIEAEEHATMMDVMALCRPVDAQGVLGSPFPKVRQLLNPPF